MLITITRTNKTQDGIFGRLNLDWNPFYCFTIENLDKAIPVGIYDLVFDYSPRFNRNMPHIIVPSRDQAAGGDAGIRIHWGNVPANYEGCIGVGDHADVRADSIDNTVTTFNKLYAIISMQAGLKISVTEAYL